MFEIVWFSFNLNFSYKVSYVVSFDIYCCFCSGVSQCSTYDGWFYEIIDDRAGSRAVEIDATLLGFKMDRQNWLWRRNSSEKRPSVSLETVFFI
jgi:hypothetical protein